MKRIHILLPLFFILFVSFQGCSGNAETSQEEGGDILVSGISLNETSVSLNEGESIILIATVKPSNATNSSVTWSSDNTEVAVVDNGKVTAIKHGDAQITATAVSSGKKASCKITVKENLSPSVTIGITNLSCVSVVLMGKANLPSTVASDLTMGMMWSKSSGVLPSNSTKIEAKNMDKDYNYSVSLSGLDPETMYYYRSYVTQNGVDTYGETKEFTTKAIASTIETLAATDISSASAVLHAKTDIENIIADSFQYGFYYGTNSEALSSSRNIPRSENSNIKATLTTLDPETTYYFQAYIKIDGKVYKSATKEFTTGRKIDLIETLDATDVQATSAQLNARLDLSKASFSSVSYGFYYGTSQDRLYLKVTSSNLSGGKYSADLTSLSHKTKYYYQAFVIFDGHTIKSDIKELTTDLIRVTGVSLDIHTFNFSKIGETCVLRATVSPSDATDKSLSWISSNANVASVTQDGKVTAMGNGEAVITVKTNDGEKIDECTISVKQTVTRLTLDKTSISLKENDVQPLTVTVTPDNAYDKTVTWSSSDSSIAIVDENGIVKAISKGSTVITAKANDGSNVYATCKVTVTRGVSGVTLNTHSAAMYPGESVALEAIVTPETADNRNVVWTSVNPAIATVSNNGLVSGVASGATTVIVRTQDGAFEDRCDISVWYHVSEISIDKNSVELYPNETTTLIASVLPDNAHNKNVTWSSSNTSIARVTQDGVITAVSTGTTTVYVKSEDGDVSASCKIRVKQYATGIDLTPASATIYADESLALTATVSPSTTANKDVTWSSSDPSVASVENGVVTPHKKGHVVITARTADGSNLSATSEISIKAAVPEGAVDLGLSVYWATCDLGAKNSQTPGELYAWGETSTKSSYTIDNYKYYDGTSYTKYNSIDGKAVLDLEDDAAHFVLKGSWRMPTIEEYKELYNNCTIVQVGSAFTFTSKIEGFTDKSVTIPVRGFSIVLYKCHWTSSNYVGIDDTAIMMNLGIGVITSIGNYRYDGVPIRPVYEQ